MRIPLLALFIALAQPASAQELQDASTGQKFAVNQTVGGESYTCLGAGVRKVFLFKVYALTYCLQSGKAEPVVQDFVKRAYPSKSGDALASALEDDQRFFDSLASAPSDKLVIMKLVRNISRDQIAGAFKDSLSKVLPKEKVDKLIATIPSDAKDGETIHIYSQGSKLVIDIAGAAKTLDDQEIAQKLWLVWLGPDGVSPSLKQSIARRAAP